MTKQTILTFDPFRYATEIESDHDVLLAQPRNRAERIFVNILAFFNQSVRLSEIWGQQDDLYDFKLLGKYLVLEFINFFDLSKKLLCVSDKHSAYKQPLQKSTSFFKINQELRKEDRSDKDLNPLNDQFMQKFDRIFQKHIRELKIIRNTFTAHSDHNANKNDINHAWNYINLRNLSEIAVAIEEFIHEVIRSNPSMEVLTVNGPFFDNDDEMEQHIQKRKEENKQSRVGHVVEDYLTQDCERKPNKSGE